MIVPRSVHVALATALVVASLAACKRSSGPARPPAGTERGDCRGDGSCDDGLECRSNLCVRPPPADCTKVAEQLSYLLLDNYAPQEQRAAFMAEIRRQCQDTHLDKDDGECLVRAQHRAELRECPRPLGIGDCEKIKAHVERLRGTSGVDAYLVTGADRIVGRCKGEAPTLAFEQCVLAARTLDDVERCPW
jgi:hypothetical protein